jgi:acetolactate synthase-1/2/3 large subunit
MKASDYVVDFLIKKGVTDVFGMPGGVVLDFLCAIGRRKEEITAHLNFHEQAAAFAACGYAQVSGKLGVAYSTRGPGVTNMVTGMADAFCDSIPMLFITAHSRVASLREIRFEENQEFDTVRMFSGVTKYAVRVEHPQDVGNALGRACHLAVSGRPGPVFLDFLADLWRMDVAPGILETCRCEADDFVDCRTIVESIKKELETAKRPVLLIGDGLRQSGVWPYIETIADKLRMPVISSRFSQDIMPASRYYYGYIGSHALRCGNFVLSKCDLVISLGNRLAYNPDSRSFARFARRAKIIRVDVDRSEFERKLPNTLDFCTDLRDVVPMLAEAEFQNPVDPAWIDVCDKLRDGLRYCDTGYPVGAISQIIKSCKKETMITSDVGNNEFWLSRAYALSGMPNRVLYSKSFGALGCSLPKAIGAHYATGESVLCFVGDQGLQMNMQELQLVAHEKPPIKIVVLNNASSGMIRDGQRRKYGPYYIHTTVGSGYSVPDFAAVAHAFSMPFFSFSQKDFDGGSAAKALAACLESCIIELVIDEEAEVLPFLPKGRPCQDFDPKLDEVLFNYLDEL